MRLFNDFPSDFSDKDITMPSTSGLNQGVCIGSESESDAEPFSPDVSEYCPSTESDDTDLDKNKGSQTSAKLPNMEVQNIIEPEYLVEDAQAPEPLDPQLVLDGMQETPTRTEKPRKRLRQSEKWKRNISKFKKQHGEAYISSRNKFVPGACMRDPCTITCRKKCFQKISDEERLAIFRRYYELDSYERKRDFIHSNTEKIIKINTTKEASRRNFTVFFYLPTETEKVKVCKTMFLNTLGIRKGVVDIAMTKRTKENTSEPDNRGRHIKKQTNQEIVNSVRNHIGRFPVVESHYCRSDTKRKYLDPSLNINIMYEMYKQSREESELEVAKPHAYRKIFNEEYNLGFHRPKKDQCRICLNYKTSGNIEEATYQLHLLSKNEARQEKRNDKERAQQNHNYVSLNFDLQQVLLAPTDPRNNALFYKQRLKTFNFTIYNVASQQGDCFMWTETNGKRGSCEIATCLYEYFQSLSEEINHISCFSDRCGGQNLNRFVATMCLTAVQELPHLKTIDLKFLVVGHSEMQCDSMHSAITTEQNRVGKVNWPADWKTIARSARRKGDKPYIVHDMSFENFIDWKSYADNNLTIRKEDVKGEAVSWQKMCWLNFSKDRPFVMRFKEKFEEEFRTLDCTKRTRSKSGFRLVEKKCLYIEALPISNEKYTDLNSLFTLVPPAISLEYKPFYENIPHKEHPKNKKNKKSRESQESEESGSGSH